MTDTAPAPIHIVSGPLDYLELAGRYVLEQGLRPYKFAVHDGDRRRFGERTPRPAHDLKIVRKENPQCPPNFP